jgi:hypothetical protein
VAWRTRGPDSRHSISGFGYLPRVHFVAPAGVKIDFTFGNEHVVGAHPRYHSHKDRQEQKPDPPVYSRECDDMFNPHFVLTARIMTFWC